jgi:hypothetical protein
MVSERDGAIQPKLGNLSYKTLDLATASSATLVTLVIINSYYSVSQYLRSAMIQGFAHEQLCRGAAT